VIVPSASLAAALMVTVAGAENTDPLVGVMIDALGALFCAAYAAAVEIVIHPTTNRASQVIASARFWS
jgi:hypothetical protein